MNKRLVFLLIVMVVVVAKFLKKADYYIEEASATVPSYKKNNAKNLLDELHFDEGFYRAIKSVIRNKENISQNAKVGIYIPNTAKSKKSMPLFFAMRPGVGSGLSAINQYKKFADELGFIVAAVGLDSNNDNEDSRLYYMLNCIKNLSDEGLLDDEPVFIGGFSGGGKWSLHLGAWAGDYFSGILGIGTNEDLASFGYRQTANKSCFDLPIVMLNGTNDDVAGTNDYNYYSMFWRMKETGFKKVKVMVYEGAHSIPYKETLEAFEYLLENYSTRRLI